MKSEQEKDVGLTPEKAIELLQIIKTNDQNLSVVLGFDSAKKIKDFIIVRSDTESELQAELLLSGYCSKTSIASPKDIMVSQFKEILRLVNIDPLALLGADDDLARNITDMAIDDGALFSDEAGGIIRVLGLEDHRTVKEFMMGNNEDGILIMFSGNNQASITAGRSHKLKDVRSLIEQKRLSALF